jgi:hypothetical protein
MTFIVASSSSDRIVFEGHLCDITDNNLLKSAIRFSNKFSSTGFGTDETNNIEARVGIEEGED